MLSLLFYVLFPALVAIVASNLLTPAARLLALRVGAIDKPGPRKVHHVPIPRLGGLAVVGAVALVLAPLCAVHPPVPEWLPEGLCPGLALGLLPILLVSLRDDIRPLGAMPKLGAQLAGAGIAVSFGIRLGTEVHVFGQPVQLGFLAIPISLLWIVGLTNAFNLVDGLDGLSAGLALISSLSLAAVSFLVGRYGMASASLILSGALVGFLPYNIFPAKVFLGDTGATAVGFGLACLALRGGATLSAGMAVLIPVVVLGLPIAEASISVLRRLLRKAQDGEPRKRLLDADREHFHHKLIARGLGHRRAVLTLYGVGLILAACGLASMFLTTRKAALLFATLLCAAFIGLARLGYYEFAIIRRGLVLKFYESPVLRTALFPVFVDLGLVVLALYAAIGLKYDDWFLVGNRVLALRLVSLLPAVTVLVFWACRVYRGTWRHISVEDLVRSSTAVVLSATSGFVLYRLVLDETLKFSLFLIYLLLLLVLVNGSRSSFRLLRYWKERGSPEGQLVVLYGSGHGGTLALREALSNRSLAIRPLGFIDDDTEKTGKYVNGYPVLGSLETLPLILREKNVKGLVVTTEKILPESLRAARRVCEQEGVWLMRFTVAFGALSK
jgi:UDP-GlcNAc:undecaprenyl-phosphate GlcNAc-1-phosphate transferase